MTNLIPTDTVELSAYTRYLVEKTKNILHVPDMPDADLILLVLVLGVGVLADIENDKNIIVGLSVGLKGVDVMDDEMNHAGIGL